MKHAQDAALDRLEGLLERLRQYPELKEKKRGVFYYRGKACLHFHEDAAGLFADLRLKSEDWQRFPITQPTEQDALLRNLITELDKLKGV